MLYLQLLERMSVIALAAYIFSQTYIFKRFFTKNISIEDNLIFISFFSILSIIGTYLGVKVQGGAIANIRPIGAVVAGIVGGPIVGIIVGLLAGIHRYTLGGFTALACAISTIVEGLIGGLFKIYFKNTNKPVVMSFVAGIVAEIAQVIIVIFIAKPMEAAIELEKSIGLPMILINSIGTALFINIILGVKEEVDKVVAYNSYKALNIAKKSSIYIKQGFNKESAKYISQIISNEIGIKCIFMSDTNDILFSTQGNEENLKPILIKINLNLYNQLIKYDDRCFYIIKFFTQDLIYIGCLGINIKNCSDVDKYYLNFLDELGELLSTQIEINRLNKIAQNAFKSELNALKAQIHPHFLFNALNTIASFCRTNPNRARDLILQLSNYFRGTLKRNEEFVKVIDELNLINSYIFIEKARFGDRLNFVCEMDDGIKDIKIPTFLLQPLIENAIKHGISPKEDGGSVFLKGTIDGKYIIFTIEDTGVGFDNQEKNYLNKGEGIGISNIIERLNLYYGENFQFKIDSSIKEGTKITLKIPIMEVYYGKN